MVGIRVKKCRRRRTGQVLFRLEDLGPHLSLLSCDGVSHAIWNAEVLGSIENKRSLLCSLPEEEVCQC